MRKSIKKKVAIFLLAGTVLGNVPIMSYAADNSDTAKTRAHSMVTGSSIIVNLFGHRYEIFSNLQNNTLNPFLTYDTYVQVHDINNPGYGDFAPAGYMGAQSRLYNRSGILVSSTNWIYDDQTSFGMNCPGTYTPAQSGGLYYSQGLVDLYNGNGYNTYETTKSPYLAKSAMPIGNLEESSFPTNTSGESYGSALLASDYYNEPDLIIVEGVNGNVGYVKKSQLDSLKASTLEQALASREIVTSIPVYTIDGETIIDSFVVGN